MIKTHAVLYDINYSYQSLKLMPMIHQLAILKVV